MRHRPRDPEGVPSMMKYSEIGACNRSLPQFFLVNQVMRSTINDGGSLWLSLRSFPYAGSPPRNSAKIIHNPVSQIFILVP